MPNFAPGGVSVSAAHHMSHMNHGMSQLSSGNVSGGSGNVMINIGPRGNLAGMPGNVPMPMPMPGGASVNANGVFGQPMPGQRQPQIAISPGAAAALGLAGPNAAGSLWTGRSIWMIESSARAVQGVARSRRATSCG
mgnify:CR=1 FL=1